MAAPKKTSKNRAKVAWKSAKVAKHFRELSGEQFEKLMFGLLGADCWVAGLDVGDFHWDLAGNKGDGGVDGLIRRAPPSPTKWVKRPAVFQAKLSCPPHGKLIVELKKARVAGALQSGHDYVLVTGAAMGPDRSTELEQVIRALYPGWKGSALVIGEQGLVDWLRVYPSVWSLMPEAQRPNGVVKSFDHWEALLLHRDRLERFPEFVQTPERQQVFDRLRQPGVHSVHIEGSPGVGKTRCVLEAFRDRREVVAYSPRFNEDLLRLPTEPGRVLFGWLVVDECNEVQREQLETCFANAPLRLVTIAADLVSAPYPPRSNAVRLEVLEGDQLAQVAERMGSDLLPVERARLVALSGGYVKLLRVLFAAAKRYPTDADVRNALLRYLGSDDLNEDAFIVLGLPRYFRRDQLESLAKVAGREAADLRRAVRALEDKGLLGDVDEQTHYVTPLLLGEMLARAFWKEPNAFVRMVQAELGTGLLKSCLSRLLQMPEGGEVLGGIGPDALVAALGPENLAEFLPGMAASAPEQVVAAVRRLLPQLKDSKDRERFVPAMRSAAWFAETFASAVDVMVELIADGKREAEPLRSLFGAHLGLTRADGDGRLSVLERLVRSSDQRTRRLGFLCAAGACEAETGGFVPQLPEPVENAWRPADRAAEAEYRQRAARLLALGLMDPDPDTANLTRTEVTRAVRGLVRARHAGASAILLRAWASTNLLVAPVVTVVDTIAVHDGAFVAASGPAEAAAFAQAAASLAPRGIADRLSMVARPASWGEPNADAIASVAQAAMAEFDLTVVADWCFSSDAVVAVELGRAFAANDPQRRLLWLLLARAPGQRLLRTAASYCAALEDIDQLLETWATDQTLAALCFEIFWLLDPSANRVEALGRLLSREFLPPRSVEQLLFGAWLLRAPRTSALEFIELVGHREPVAAFRLAFQLLGKETPEGSPHAGADNSKLLRARWLAVPIDAVSGGQLEWEWATTARRLATASPNEVGMHLLEAIRSESHPSEFHQILDSLISQSGPEVLLKALAILEAEPFRTIGGGFRGIASFPDQGVLESWATSVERARILVRVGLPLAAGGVLERLLAKFDIGGDLEARFLSGSFVGQESDWLEGKKAQLTPLLSPPASLELRVWAKRLMKRLEADIKRSRSVEKAYEAGVLPLPWVAEQ
jgi:hypothetical protein